MKNKHNVRFLNVRVVSVMFAGRPLAVSLLDTPSLPVLPEGLLKTGAQTHYLLRGTVQRAGTATHVS